MLKNILTYKSNIKIVIKPKKKKKKKTHNSHDLLLLTIGPLPILVANLILLHG